MILCPKHHIPLNVTEEKINLFGKEIITEIGVCPVCKEKYIGYKSNFSILNIDGVRYLYLPQLSQQGNTRGSANVKKVDNSDKNTKDPNSLIKQKTKISDNNIASNTSISKDKITQKNNAAKNSKTPSTSNTQKNRLNKKRNTYLNSKQFKNESLEITRSRIYDNEYFFFNVNEVIYNCINFSNCKKCGDELIYVERVKANVDGKEVTLKGYCCLNCRCLYLPNKDNDEITQHQSIKNEHQHNTYDDFIDFTNPNKTLYISKGVLSCKNKGHTLESITGVVVNTNEVNVKINANYCHQCNKYFLEYSEYDYYRKMYGSIMGNLKIINSNNYENDDTFFYNLSSESTLHLCGYTVSQNSYLTDDERQNILAYLVDKHILTKSEIISHLNFLIRTNRYNRNMEIALLYWNSDLNFIRSYQLNEQRRVTIEKKKKNY